MSCAYNFSSLSRQNSNLSATQISTASQLGLRTTQRLLQELLVDKTIIRIGQGKNTVYGLSPLGILNYKTDASVDLDESRLENSIINFNFEIFSWLQNYNFS